MAYREKRGCRLPVELGAQANFPQVVWARFSGGPGTEQTAFPVPQGLQRENTFKHYLKMLKGHVHIGHSTYLYFKTAACQELSQVMDPCLGLLKSVHLPEK